MGTKSKAFLHFPPWTFFLFTLIAICGKIHHSYVSIRSTQFVLTFWMLNTKAAYDLFNPFWRGPPLWICIYQKKNSWKSSDSTDTRIDTERTEAALPLKETQLTDQTGSAWPNNRFFNSCKTKFCFLMLNSPRQREPLQPRAWPHAHCACGRQTCGIYSFP